MEKSAHTELGSF